MSISEGFFTISYNDSTKTGLTPAMEDYLEMICRLNRQSDVVRLGELAQNLHVKPSSASKMTQQLRQLGYINAEKYGYITLTDLGRTLGDYLLYRHDVLVHFLQELNRSEDELAQAEQIEHFLNSETISNLDLLTKRLKIENEQNADS